MAEKLPHYRIRKLRIPVPRVVEAMAAAGLFATVPQGARLTERFASVVIVFGDTPADPCEVVMFFEAEGFEDIPAGSIPEIPLPASAY